MAFRNGKINGNDRTYLSVHLFIFGQRRLGCLDSCWSCGLLGLLVNRSLLRVTL